MSQHSSTFEDIANTIAEYASETGGDVQRYIVIPAMLEMIGQVGGKEILEIYCGAGYLSRRLAGLGAKVTAVDGSERLIEIAGEINNREDNAIKYAVKEASVGPMKFTRSFAAKAIASEKVPKRTINLSTFAFLNNIMTN